MTDPGAALSLSAALLAGLAGSAHCFAMCGGFAGALGMKARMNDANDASVATSALLYQAGRISGYALAGAIFGVAGGGMAALLDLARVGFVMRIASGTILILIALRLLVRWNALARLERWGAKLWLHIQPIARNAAGKSGPLNSMLLGLLWGWMPCGLVYSMLMFAVLSADAMRGAIIMAAFGVGTLPSMLTSTWLAPQLTRFVGARWSRLSSGVLLLAFGGWMIAATVLAGSDVQHAH